MSTRVLLLRHAESADPTVFHGAESDVGLSDRGRLQAELVAPLLAALTPSVVISSGMRRARETAAPIARACGLVVRIEPQLHERRVGMLSGTPTGGTEGVWPETLKRWVSGDTAYAPPGAESFDDIRGRVTPVWQRLTKEYQGQKLVVVAHGVVNKVLLLSLLKEFTVADWHRLGPSRNVAINELVQSAGIWHAVRLNDLAPEVGELPASAGEGVFPRNPS